MKSKGKNKLLEECCNGYGFEVAEIPSSDGFYCTGCLTTHKRPTKMYTDGQRENLCADQVIRLFNPNDD